MRGIDMELIGSGVDIVDNRRIRRIHGRYPEAFARRILHARELEEFADETNKPQYLASRFSVKEAIAKAFGLGIRAPMTWRNICISHDALGKPEAHFEEVLRDHLGVDALQVSVSISHEQHYTVAHAIAFDNGP